MRPPLPAPLQLSSPFPFVGRSQELATLRSLIPRLPGEGGRVALLGGEAGSGKSRLVREVAAQAATEGVMVLYGASDPVVRTPFGPFVQALSQLVRASDARTLHEDMGPAGGELTRLLPDLELSAGELPPPGKTDPDTGRHRLHTAFEDLLSNVSARLPVLLLVEDVHWADTQTLHLLRHLAWARRARMLVLATFRDTEVEMPPDLAGTLADLRRCDDLVPSSWTGSARKAWPNSSAGPPAATGWAPTRTWSRRFGR